MRIIKRLFLLMVFMSLGNDCMAASSGFDPIKDKTILIIIGLFVLGWFVVGMTGEIRGSTKSSEDKGYSLFVLFGVVAVILFLVYECS